MNIHFYPNPILETSRLSYLVGNGAFVISEHSKDPILDRDYGQYVVWADYDYLVETSIKYLMQKDDRINKASEAYDKFIKKEYAL